MRRTIVLLTMMAMTLLVATSVAVAEDIKCLFSGKCIGTIHDDYIFGGEGDNLILARAGDDGIVGNTGDDVILGHDDQDEIYGGSGNDLMNGNDGSDLLYGGPGNDTYYHSGQGVDWYSDSSFDSSDTYWGFHSDLSWGIYSIWVEDWGGDDLLDLSTFNREQVCIDWWGTSVIVQPEGTNQHMYFTSYFDHMGGGGRGHGAIEAIKYKDVTDRRFPFPQSPGEGKPCPGPFNDPLN